MRICMIMSTPLPPREGIGFYVWNLSRYLTSQGHQVQIITRGGTERLRRETIADITIWRAPFLPVYPFHVHLHGFLAHALLAKLEESTDLFHIHSPLPPVIATRRPILLTMHSAVRDDVRATKMQSLYTAQMKLQAPVSYRIEQQLLQRAAAVSVVAPKVAAAVRTYPHAPARIDVMWNGVDIETFSPPAQERDQRLLLSVGRLAPGKGVEDLLYALALVNQASHKPVQLIVAGEGQLRASLEQLSSKLGLAANVTFLGQIAQRQQLAELYRRATLFVLPSHHEGLPTVLLEAMACATPTISTAVGGIPDAVSDGRDAYLVAPNEPSALATAITRLLQDTAERQRLGQAARESIERNFSWKTVGRSYVDRYQALLGVAA